MEKQIFISQSCLTDELVICDYLEPDLNSSYFILLGLVNHILGDKANCKKVLSIDYHNTGYDEIDTNLPTEKELKEGSSKMTLKEYYQKCDNYIENGTKGYLITYLESEMIAR